LIVYGGDDKPTQAPEPMLLDLSWCYRTAEYITFPALAITLPTFTLDI